MKQQAQAWWRQATQIAQQAVLQTERFDALVTQLAVRDPHICVPTSMALQQAGPSAIPALLAGLTHTHPRVRRACVDIIDHGGYGADGRCITALLPLLHDPVPHIRRAVWHTLFCERCQDVTKCAVLPTEKLDQVALLIEVGLHDPNPKLRGQLIDELRRHQADGRARAALENLKEGQ
ncbi:MAG: HEAT repeat domain-containing protein [Caldilineaceae bacterium]